MNDLDMARRAHKNMVAAFASLPDHQPDGFVHRDGGVVVAATGSPVVLFNEVLPVEDGVAADALAAGIERVRAAGLPFLVQLRDSVDDALLPVVEEFGLAEAGSLSWPAMVLTDLPTRLDGPAELEIRRAAGPADFDRYLRDSAAVAGGNPARTATWLGRGVSDDPDWTLLTGHVAGAPVAKSMSFRSGGVVGVYDVATAEAARRRGYGWALTLAAIMAGVEARCTMATLQSSAMALPMYEAHGFRTLYRYRAFRDI
jgi:ribosomal protein S18 acetylase RimI-like enzyme